MDILHVNDEMQTISNYIELNITFCIQLIIKFITENILNAFSRVCFTISLGVTVLFWNSQPHLVL